MKNTVFFGNGFNMLSANARSWNDLLMEIKRVDARILTHTTNTLQYEDLYLGNKVRGYSDARPLTEYDTKFHIANLVRRFKPNEFYRQLAELEVDSYITTNYDYVLDEMLGYLQSGDTSETKYSIRRYETFVNQHGLEKTIRHIHGEANSPNTIMLGFDHYCSSIGKISAYITGKYDYKNRKLGQIVQVDKMSNKLKRDENDILSWIDLFFMHNIHIIGFGLDFSEQDIWWILNRRKRYDHEGVLSIENKIYYYDVDVHDDKAELLKDFGIEVRNFPSESDSPDWPMLYAQMLDDLRRNL